MQLFKDEKKKKNMFCLGMLVLYSKAIAMLLQMDYYSCLGVF